MSEQIKPVFWKLSQGEATSGFTFADMLSSIDEKLVYIHKDTQALGGSNKTQFEYFVSANIGDYFYLTHSNQGIYLLGQFTGAVNYFSKKNDDWAGWASRPFKVVRYANDLKPYVGDKKWWTPNHNSTFVQVPQDELTLFETNILKPYFDISLKDFGFEQIFE